MGTKVWSNVQVDFQSALATAVAITGITQANPPVVSHAGTDPSNGDFVVLTDVEGMPKLNNRVARVANQAAGTFELEGIDGSAFPAFTSGNFAVITFGTSASTFTDVSPSGGAAIKADVSVIHNDQNTEIRTGTEPFSMQYTSLYNLGSAALLALKAVSDVAGNSAVRITFSDNELFLFYGGVTASLIPGGSARAPVTTIVEVDAAGLPTAYAV